MEGTQKPVFFSPWHHVSPGDNTPKIVNAIIEIPKGCKAKYELDKASGLLKLDRILFSAVHYPANYGFIPQTYCEDGDPLDILVICQEEIEPMALVEAKVIGVMGMLDGGEKDDKIIAVAANDMSVNHIDDVSGLPPHSNKEIQRFFSDYKKLENKTVQVEEFQDNKAGWKIVEDAIKLYNENFENGVKKTKK